VSVPCRPHAVARQAALIADNMAKLVDNPAEAMVFLPRLMPEIEKVRPARCAGGWGAGRGARAAEHVG
jgi:hypothetical protein